MHFNRAVPKLPGKSNNFRNDQFCHAPGVTKRRVEHGNAVLRGISQVHLIGTNAEAAYDNKILGLLQHSGCELGFRADADDVNISCCIFQPMHSSRKGAAYLIFSINWSSASEDFRNST